MRIKTGAGPTSSYLGPKNSVTGYPPGPKLPYQGLSIVNSQRRPESEQVARVLSTSGV